MIYYVIVDSTSSPTYPVAFSRPSCHFRRCLGFILALPSLGKKVEPMGTGSLPTGILVNGPNVNLKKME